MASLEDLVRQALDRIETSEDRQSLKNYYSNIKDHKDLTELQKEELTEAVMQRLRTVSPATATRIGGPKDANGRAFLQTVYEQSLKRYDLSRNRVGLGVKTGGYMINGTRFVDVYLSYKSADDMSIGLAWIQEAPEKAPYLEVMLRHVRRDVDELPFYKRYEGSDTQDEAVETYLELLGERVLADTGGD